MRVPKWPKEFQSARLTSKGALVCGVCLGTLAIALCLGLLLGQRDQQLGASIVVGIEREPPSAIMLEREDDASSPRTAAASAADSAQSIPDTQSSEDTPAVEQEAPERLYIADAVRLQLADPGLRKSVRSEDLAAMESFYGENDKPALWITSAGISPAGKAVLDELEKAKDWGLEPSAFVVPPSDYQPASTDDQAAAEAAISLSILRYARYARGDRLNPSALSELFDQSPSLRDPKTVLAEIGLADDPAHYLTTLHPQHVQFSLLREKLISIRTTDQTETDETTRLLINLERWRWMPEELGAPHVWLNTPEFMMHVVKGETIIHSEKTVVGKRRYATPVFSANMQSIVFNPKWTVPPTIVREDLLPKLRKGGSWFGGSDNTAVLKQHGLRVFYKGRPVNPKKINWKKVNMRAISFVQAPGPKNYLGKVKFLYPNKHIVYMHDTIKRWPFKKEVRAEGHHCPRVENPGTVAAVLLAEDKGWERGKIDELLKNGKDSEVDLDEPIPVHTTYFTAVVDADGQLQTFGDIYNLDDIVARALADAKTGSQKSLETWAQTRPWNDASRASLAVSTP